ncbi:Hsp70 family protein [Pseudonocardia sp. Cha107L01]|uniref:Hsp70 family protein n=1 Tax=Pseudonocardia sp. Cha107L01 TaxID=3457576 RepID=UPI00403E5601
MVGYLLSVDLGTTFVAAALSSGSQLEMFTLGERSVVAPALVYLGEDNTLVTGEAANRLALSSPERVAREFKRRLGDPTPIRLAGTPLAVTELLATLLRDVLAKVTKTEGTPPQQVVLTHPATWGPLRRGLFDEVAHLAGLSDTPTHTLSEPEAAAAHYTTSRGLRDGELIAVYDLGGGTFDVTVLHAHPRRVEILGIPEGIERLGGIDFDDALFNHIDHASGGAISNLDVRDQRTGVALARVRQDCVLAKEDLSTVTETVIPVFLPELNFDLRITRAQFEDLVRAQVESTVGALARTLRSAQVNPAQLTAVLLVGGSSRIPLVARTVSEALGVRTVVDAHPKHAVALGAAALGSAIAQGQVVRRVQLAAAHSRAVLPAATAIATANRSSVQRTQALTSDSPVTEGARPPITPGAGRGPVDQPPDNPVSTPGTTAPTSRSRWGVLTAVVLLTGTAVVSAVLIPQTWHAPSILPATSALATASPQPSRSTPGVISVGQGPSAVAISPDGRRAYVPNAGSGAMAGNTVSVIDTATNTVIATVPVGVGPSGVAITPGGGYVYVANGDANSVSVIDTVNDTVTATVPVGREPSGVAITADGRDVYVPNAGSGSIAGTTVSVIDTTTNTLTATILVGFGPSGVALTPDGRRGYVTLGAANSVSVINPLTNKTTRTISVGPNPLSVAITPDGHHAYVTNHGNDTIASSTVSVIDTTTNRVTATIPVGFGPSSVVITPDGHYGYVTNQGTDSAPGTTVSVIDTTTNRVTATIPVGFGPSSVVITPDGHHGYVTNQGTDSAPGASVSVIDTVRPSNSTVEALRSDIPHRSWVPVSPHSWRR